MRTASCNLLATLALTATLAAASGCANTSGFVESNGVSLFQAKAATVNGYDPVHPAMKVNQKVTPLTYKGRLIGFASNQSKTTFKHWPIVRKDAFVHRQLALRNGSPTAVVGAEVTPQAAETSLAEAEMPVANPTITSKAH